MGEHTQQALAQMLRATAGQQQLQLDEFMLEHCCRVAEVTSTNSEEEVLELTDLINQLFSQARPGELETSIALTTQQVKTWLQQQSQGSSEMTPMQAPTSPTGRAQQMSSSIATAACTQQPSSRVPAPVSSKLKVNATDFVPGRPLTAASGNAISGSMGAALGTAVSGSMRTGGQGTESGCHAARSPPPGFHPIPARVTEQQAEGAMQLPVRQTDGNQDASHEHSTVAAHEAAAGAWQFAADQQHSYHPAAQGDYNSAAWDGEYAYHEDHQYGSWQEWGADTQQYQGEAYGADRQQQGQDTADALQLLEAMFPLYSTRDLGQVLQWYQSDLQACVHELMRLEEASSPAEAVHSPPQEKLVPIDDDQAFPSLTGAATEPKHKRVTPAVTQTAHNKGASSSVEGLWGDQSVSKQSSWASLASKLGAPGKTATSATGFGLLASPGAQKGPVRSPHGSRVASATSSSGNAAAGQAMAVPRVATGAVLSAQYAAARAEARDWAIARNKCFEQATRAFRAGQKALAKELSAQGRMYADRMWEAHEKAAADLLQTRQAVRQGHTGGPTVIDLHGLHVQEVVSMVTQHVKAASAASKGSHHLQLVVGVGKHNTATRGRPRLLVALHDELEHMGLRVKQVEAGLLDVTW